MKSKKDTILTFNIGSSSLKFSVFKTQVGQLNRLYKGKITDILHQPSFYIEPANGKIIQEKLGGKKNADIYETGIHKILNWLKEQKITIHAVGHRIAHGGIKYRQHTIISRSVINYLNTLIPLAPLHQPYHIKGIKILRRLSPKLPQVACFDTAFHTTCHPLSQLFALPKKLSEEGIRRYGFHGLSYEYITQQFDHYLPEIADGKIIVAHLGSGATLCGIHHRKSVATTIGFSALDGLPMNTRCGTLDAGVVLYLLREKNLSITEVERILYNESGWLGVSGGISSDMNTLLRSDEKDAKTAVNLFVYRTSAWIGTLTAELGGLDGIIFTGGIGENSAKIRQAICEHANWLGVLIHNKRNQNNEIKIHQSKSKIGIYVIPTDEELMIARHTCYNALGIRAK